MAQILYWVVTPGTTYSNNPTDAQKIRNGFLPDGTPAPIGQRGSVTYPSTTSSTIQGGTTYGLLPATIYRLAWTIWNDANDTYGGGTGTYVTQSTTIQTLDSVNFLVIPNTGTVALVGYAPTVLRGASANYTPGVGTVVLTGYAPTVFSSAGANVNPGVGSIAITGYAPATARTANVFAAPGASSLVITGYTPTVQVIPSNAVNPGVGTLVISGYAPSLSQGSTSSLVPGAGPVVITGYAPTVSKSANVNYTAGVGSISIVGYAPTVQSGVTTGIVPAAGSVLLVGHVPTVVRTSALNLLPGAGPLVITGLAPTVLRSGGTVGANDVWQYEIEAGYTAEELMRLMAAVLLGKTTVTDLGGGNALVTFEATNGSKIRVTASMTGNERTSTLFNDTF